MIEAECGREREEDETRKMAEGWERRITGRGRGKGRTEKRERRQEND